MSIPAWTALTAYVLGTRVTPVTTDGTVWEVETAGTSGAAEPTWPTNFPWTVVDGTVTWGKASSFRAQSVTGIYGTLTDFATANPTMLAAVYVARPRGAVASALPHAYIGDRPESIVHANQIRQRALAVSVVLVDSVPDNAEALVRMDQLIDGLVDAFTRDYHSASGYSITVETGSIQIPDEEPGASLYAEVLTISSTIGEGRA